MEINLQTNSIPYWSNWVGVWSMYEPNANALWDQVQKLDLSTHLAAVDPAALAMADNFEMSVVDGVGLLNLSGPMMKHRSSLGGSISTVEATRAVRSADRNDDIQGLFVKMETPGGTVAGTMEFAKALADFSKPIAGYASDLVASAGYFALSQVGTVYANSMALVGGMGTFAKLEDTSQSAENEGVKVHIVRAGEFKGAGSDGTVIEEKHLAETQRLIDQINDSMLNLVAEGPRGLSLEKVRELADGRVHMAADAKRLGLIDHVMTFEQAFEDFQKSVSSKGVVEMTTEANASQPITPAELKERFPNATAEWRFACLEGGFTMEQCVTSNAAIQEARAEAAEAKIKQLESAAAKPGLEPVTTSGGSSTTDDGGDAVEAWHNAVAKEMKACNGNRQRAVSKANKNNPGLREAFVQQHNAINRR